MNPCKDCLCIPRCRNKTYIQFVCDCKMVKELLYKKNCRVFNKRAVVITDAGIIWRESAGRHCCKGMCDSIEKVHPTEKKPYRLCQGQTHIHEDQDLQCLLGPVMKILCCQACHLGAVKDQTGLAHGG